MPTSKWIYALSLVMAAIFMAVRAPDATIATTGNAPTINATGIVDGCDTSDQWQPFNNSCYRRLKQDLLMGWKEANHQCGLLGSHLATIRTKAENDFIVGHLMPELQDSEGNGIYQMWIGLYLKWATCDGCNNVESAKWIDDTPLEESELLPKPITLLRDKYGKYPWQTAETAKRLCNSRWCNTAQPWKFSPASTHDNCAHYYVTQDLGVGDWGVNPCSLTMMWALCQKPATK